jgi:hypothetical protein
MLKLNDGNLKFRDARRRKISPEYRNFPDTELFTSREASSADVKSAGSFAQLGEEFPADREKLRRRTHGVRPRRVI